MREHIYKAKRIDNGEWVEGYYLNFSNNHFIFIESEFEYTNDTGTLDGQAIKIDHKTLSQYTNLKDKNGNKIFENDILKFDDESFIGVCVYKEKIAQFMLGDYDKDKDWFDFQPQMAEQSIIIIGNIFDNKELLGE